MFENLVMLVFIGKLLSILSDEHLCARVSVIFQVIFCIIFIAKVATNSIRVNMCKRIQYFCDLSVGYLSVYST